MHQPTAVTRRPRAWMLPLVLLACACDSGRTGSPDHAAAWDAVQAPPLTLTRTAASPADLALTHVTSLDVDSRGQVYVADFPSLRITVLSPEGEVVRTVGRAGDGPGEFRFARDVQLLPGDSLLVFDQQHNRVTVFAPGTDSVTYIRTLFAGGAQGAPFRVHRRTDGSFVAAYARPFSASGDPRDDRGRRETLRVLDAAGWLRHDSLLVVPAEEKVVVRAPGMVTVGSSPFARRSVFGVAPDGRIFYGWTDTAAISVLSPEGRRMGSFALPQRPEPLTRAQVERAASALREPFGRAVREGAPETWPAFNALLVDERGKVWIEGSGPERRLLALGVDGRVEGAAALPPRFEPRRIRGGRLYGIQVNEDDVPQVVTFRLDAPPSTRQTP